MKRLIIIVGLAVALFGIGNMPVTASNGIDNTVQASDEDRLELAVNNYLEALTSENNGLVESAIFNSLMLKVQYPEANIDPIKSRLAKLAVQGSSHVIRYKAYLGLTFLNNRNEFAGAEELAALIEYEDPNEFFVFLDNEIKNTLLTSKR